jgi:hypothetical protein
LFGGGVFYGARAKGLSMKFRSERVIRESMKRKNFIVRSRYKGTNGEDTADQKPWRVL